MLVRYVFDREGKRSVEILASAACCISNRKLIIGDNL